MTAVLVTAGLCGDEALLRRIAQECCDDGLERGSEASEFLQAIAHGPVDFKRPGFQVVLKRDHVEVADVERYLQDLTEFWLRLFSSTPPNPVTSDRSGPPGITSLVGRAADAFHGLSADNVMVLLQNDRLENDLSWHVNPSKTGGVTIDAYKF